MLLGQSALAGGLAMLGGLPAVAQEQVSASAPTQAASQTQVYEPAFFARFAPKTAADMVGNIPGFTISGDEDDARGFGQAKQ
jgi:hypothetical protein